MPITPNPISIDLSQATPTPLTTDKLKDQLNHIGLTCDQAAINLLAGYIDEVKSGIADPANGSQAWSILQPGSSTSAVVAEAMDLVQFDSATGLTQSSVGNWSPSPTALGYASTLEYLQFPAHFNWLKANRSTFTGVGPTPNSYSGTDMTVDAIKTQFAMVATNASAALVNGVSRDAVESALSNAISPVQEANAKDYNVTDSRTMFLVQNYNPATNAADGIGVMTVEWTLVISDYATKKGPVPLKHNYSLVVTAWAVMYDDVAVMNADSAAAHSAIKSNAFLAIPAKSTTVTVFETLPPANELTFNQSLPVLATKNSAAVLVLYAPNLQNIGSIDNTKSKASASYSKAVETGFTFSTTQTLTATASFEVSVEVVKAGVSVGLSISFTEQWSKSTTETISFEVPPGELTFMYQGFLLASVLTLDAASGTYSFGEAARCLSPVLVTSDKPLTGVATINSSGPASAG